MYHHPGIQGNAHQGLSQPIPTTTKHENTSSKADPMQQLHGPTSSSNQDFSGNQQNETTVNHTLRYVLLCRSLLSYYL